MQQAPIETPEAIAERRRLHLVKVIEIIYWLLIFEGAFRKWVFPSLEKPLYFLRDPFVVYAYLYAWKYNLLPRGKIFLACIIASAAFLGLVFVQFHVFDNPLPTGLFGWRMYFLNLPLAFIAGAVLNGHDLKRIIRRTLMLSIPMAVLVVLQYKSPPDAFINRLIDGSESFNYSGVARANGTFSFTQGHVFFCHSLACFVLATWLLPGRQRPMKFHWLVIATVAVLINIVLNGNRSVFLAVGSTFAFSSIYRLIPRREKRSVLRSIMPEVVLLMGLCLYTTVFSDAYDAMKKRIEENQGEAQGRIAGLFTTLGSGIESTHLLGNGIGAGSKGGKVFLPKYGLVRMFNAGEEVETGRIVSECGPAGLLYLAFRYFLACVLAAQAFVASRRSHNPLPLTLASFPILTLVAGQITLNGSANGYAWIFVGLSLAANRLGEKSVKEPV